MYEDYHCTLLQTNHEWKKNPVVQLYLLLGWDLLNSLCSSDFVLSSCLHRLVIISSAVWLHTVFSYFCSRLKTGIMATSCWTKRDTSFILVSDAHVQISVVAFSFCCKVLLREDNKSFPFPIYILISGFISIHGFFFMPVQYCVYICVGFFCVNLALQNFTTFRKVYTHICMDCTRISSYACICMYMYVKIHKCILGFLSSLYGYELNLASKFM